MSEEIPMLPPTDIECPLPKLHAPSLNVNDSLENVVARIMKSNEGKLFRMSIP